MAKYVKIKHNGKILLEKVKYCDTFFSRLKGLMFSRKLGKKEGLLIDMGRESKKATAIHMFFVFFPIDVFWLDKDLKVVDIRKKVYPFIPLIMPKKKAQYVLEVSSGVIGKELEGKRLIIK